MSPNPTRSRTPRGSFWAASSRPGCIEYHLHQDNDNPAEFTFYENWTNRAEWDKHMVLPHLAEFAKMAPILFAKDPHIRLMTMISER